MDIQTSPDLDLLHRRYAAQAEWTRSIRQRLLDLANPRAGDWLLEVGSGTGVITSELGINHSCHVVGIDIDFATTRFAMRLDHFASYLVADGVHLPFPDRSFDVVLCHFLLLWTPEPERILREMLRAARPGAWVIAFAEPDYGGRIDHPAELVDTGVLQTKSLKAAGADPFLGRRLRALFQISGAQDIMNGVLGAEWQTGDLPQILETEWGILQRDLQGQVPPEDISAQLALDETAVAAGTRTLFVPTFFAMGRSPARFDT